MTRRYGVWSGNPQGYREDTARCAEVVGGGSNWGRANETQCQRKRGHGAGGEYCKQHAKKHPVPQAGV